jgi:hypothetical protein
MALQASIEDQQQHNHTFKIAKYASIDPHKGIKEFYSESQNIEIIPKIWDPKRKYSNDLQFAYCWGTNNGVRGASIRAMQLHDLNISLGYGPNRDDSIINRTLLLIFCSGIVHKERFTILQKNSVHRHRDYHWCSVFATSLLVILKLQTMAGKLTYSHNLWFTTPLTNFKTPKQMSKGMRNVLKEAKILNPAKIMHHCAQCVLYAASHGLTEYQIRSLTKRVTECLAKNYMPKVDLETCKVMSGSTKTETQFVPSEHIVFRMITINM